jgi:uncharacterized protein YoxC
MIYAITILLIVIAWALVRTLHSVDLGLKTIQETIQEEM